MPETKRFLFALAAAVAMVDPGIAHAQSEDAEWIRSCRRDRYNAHRYSHCEVRETRTRSESREVVIEDVRNGGVSVAGWDKDSIVVRARIRTQGRSEAAAREIANQVRVSVNRGNIRATGPRTDDGDGWSVSFITSVPRHSDVRVDAANGPVSVAGVSGNMNLETRNGPLSLRDLAGSVRARSANGPLSIVLSGDRWEGAGMDARTTNGPLTISVPDGYSAHLEAGTTNGPMSVGFPIRVSGRLNRNISTDLGSGGATVRAETTNGPLTIRRR